MPNTIAENLQRLTAARTAIGNAIVTKGGTVNSGDGLEEFPADIMSIKNDLTSIDITENGTYYGGEETVVTSSTFPVVINDSIGTPIKHVDINGNTTQNGTPTPDNPVDVNGVGERTAQLYNSADTIWILGILDDNGQNTGATTSHYTSNFTEVKANKSYAISGTLGASSNQYRIYFYDAEKRWVSRTPPKLIIENSFTTPVNCKYIQIQVVIAVENTTDWMLNEGSTAKPYEPYGYKIPILSGGVTTNIYLGSTQTVRQIKKLVLGGTENWTYEATYSRFYISVNDFSSLGLHTTPFLSNAFVSVSDGRPIENVPDNTIYSGSTGNDVHKIYIKCTSYTSADEFKAYLQQQYAAGTPVTIWYVLATEETAAVNEPLMKIGDYADSVSVDIELPLSQNTKNNIDIDTTVKPSSASFTYNKLSDYIGYNEINVNVQTSFTQSDEGKVVSNGALVAQTPLSQDITQNGTYDTTLNNSVTVNVSGGGTMPDRYLTVDQLNENNEPKKISIYGAPGDVFNWFSTGYYNTTFSFGKVEEIVLDEDFVSIGQDYTFRYFNELKIINLPSQITNIPAYTFQGCSSLVSGFDLTNIETIGNYAFDGCSSLDINADLSKVQSIPYQAFQGCENLTTVKITNQTTSIGYKAFYNCKKMNGNIDLSNVSSLGEASFYNCNSIDKPLDVSNVATIRGNTFDGCKKVPSITLKDNFVLSSSSSQRVFADCESLTSILQPATWPSNTVPLGTYSGCINLEQSFDLTGATTIESEAFMNCKKMLNPTVGTISSLGAKVFLGCSSITEFHFNAGSTISYIYEQTFRDCTSLALITFAQDSKITQFGRQAFANTKITSITAPTTLKTISDRCFEDCSDLVEVDLSGSVYTPSYYGLATYLFNNCVNLTTVKFPTTVEAQIGAYTFRNCPKLLSIDCPKGIKRLDQQGFAESSIEEIPQLTAEVTTLPTECFKDSGLKRIVIPDQITSIYSYCFEGCTKLTSVTFHETKNITLYSYAFSGCAALDEVIIPSNVKMTQSNIFAQDGYEGGVKRVYIKGTSDSNLGSYSFGRNTSITDVYFQWSQPSGEPPRYGLREEATIHYDWNPDAV